MRRGFDARKLERLLGDSGLDLALASSRHNVAYLTGGYAYHFHALSPRWGRSQYLPLLGLPRGRLGESFYVGRAEERGQWETEGPWPGAFLEALRGTESSARRAAEAIRDLGLGSGRLGLELPFLPADAYLALRESLPEAELLDATPLFEELRAIKSPEEQELMRRAYALDAEAIMAAFAASRPGETTRSIARRTELELAERGLSFLFALVCAGPGFLRAPSEARWEPGRVLHIDAGASLGEYVADICRMGCLGEPPPLARELHRACLEVQDEARSLVRPGLPARSLLEAGLAASRRYPFSSHARFVVHGVGMVPYEQPLFSPPSERPLEAGMVLSIETDFLHPEVGHVKIEDAVIVTPSGCEGIGDAGRDWQILEP